MDLLEVLGLSRPTAENALCLEIYDTEVLSGASSEAVESICGKCMQLIAPYVEGYIWQHEPLRLQCSTKQQPPWLMKKRGKGKAEHQQQHGSSSAGPPFVWGVLRYEDNVEDEWWVVWLLLECSRQLPSLAVRVWDDDGDFLLIEAAYALPRWLKPETSSNRVWLRQGHIHIVPPPSHKQPHLPVSPSIEDALKILSSGNIKTHNTRLEGSILARLAGYPHKAQQQLQRVAAWLPRRVGLLLQQDPQLAAAAVEAFMSRQREDVQAAAKQSNFPPTDMTTALVTLNRCMYAQLMQSDFAAPKPYPKPPTDPAWRGGDTNRQTKAYNMGLKLTTGMEIMAVRLGVSGSSSSSSTEAAAAGARDLQQQQQQQQQQVLPLSANPAWRQYLASLTASGYFDGELEGSARYKQLLAAAQAAFTSSPAYAASCEAAAAPARHLQLLLTRIDTQQQQQQCGKPNGMLPSTKATDTTTCSSSRGVRDSVNDNISCMGVSSAGDVLQLHPAAALLDADNKSEDSDSWMSEDTARAEQIVTDLEAQAAADEAKKQQRRSRKAAAAGGAAGPAAPAGATRGDKCQGVEVDAGELLAGFKGFVKAMVSHEGAEVPGGSSNKKASATQQQQQQQQRDAAGAAVTPGVEFNTDVFLRELMDIMGTVGEADARGSSSSRHAVPQQQQQQEVSAADALLTQLQLLQQQLERCLRDDTSSSAVAGAAAALQDFTQHSGRELGHEVREQHELHDHTSDDDDYGTSSSEGSSFYGSDQGSDSDDDEGLGGAEQQQGSVRSPVQLPVLPPVSGRQQQQQWQLPPSLQAAMEQQQQEQQLPPMLKKLQESWEVMTATDSDDEYNSEDNSENSEDALSLGGDEDGTNSEEGSDTEAEQSPASDSAAAAAAAKVGCPGGFYDAYSAAMDAELAGTTMVQSFERVQVPGRHQQQQQQQHGQQASSSDVAAAGADATAELAPLDVDMNLVRSLVQSYTAQGGMPGPASNLAGLLGLQLPTEILEEN